MTYYREVNCSDRLPEKEHPNNTLSKSVFVNYEDGDAGYSWYDYTVNYWFGKENVVSWLEPYEIQTEEEIWKLIFNHAKASGKTVSVDKLARAITNLLKGEI